MPAAIDLSGRMGLRPTPSHSIDRIDVNGNYEPGNCRWATQREQMSNTRKTIWVATTQGRLSLPAACEVYGKKYGTVLMRIHRGMTPEDAVTCP